MRFISPLLLGALFLLSSTSALAQTDLERATARDAANSGRAAFDAGKYEAAIDSFSRAEQLVHAPPHLLFMARSQVRLGKLVAAHETYLKITREALAAKAPKAFKDAQIVAEEENAAIDARLPSVTVTLRGAPAAGVNVQMDGATLPSAMIGIPLPVDPGEHVFQASGSAVSDAVKVTVLEAGKQSVVLDLRATALSPPPIPPANDSLTVDASQVKASKLRIASYASFGVGAVGLGLGTFFLLKSHGTRNDADALWADCHCPNDPAKQALVTSKDDDATRQQTIGVVGLIGGGVGVAAGVTLLVLDLRNSRKSAAGSALHVTPVFGDRSLGLAGTF